MSSTTASADTDQVISGQREFLFPCLSHYYKQPLVMTRASGVEVTDASGERYLDFFAGILTTSVGHCHPRVVQAIQDQVETLGHTSTLYCTAPQVEAARQLAEIAPGALKKTFFVNSGTEAIETAVMLAQIHTGRSEVIALRFGYSGRSTLATSLTGQSAWRPIPSSIAGIHHAVAPYQYRAPGGMSGDELVDFCAADLEAVIETTTTGRPAAVLAETIQGVAGYVVPPPGYFQRIAEIIRSYGGLLIIDEVQAGFGRTGKHWFGIEHWEVEPDIMVMAKGIANGFPVGATITRSEIARSWKAKTISTYGGNPLGMAAAAATITVMREEDTPARSQQRGAQLRRGLEKLSQKYKWIGEVRGMGLMQAMELVEDPHSKEPAPGKAAALMEATRDERLLVGVGGMHGHVIRIGPSMLITEEEMTEAIRRLERACQRVEETV